MRHVIGRQNAILAYVLQHEGASADEIAEALGLPSNYVRAVLVSLRDRGAVRKVGGRWVPTEVGMREVEGLGDVERFRNDKLSWVFWLGVAVLVLMALSSKDKEKEDGKKE